MANNPFQQTQATKRQVVDTWEMRKNNNYEKLDVVSKPVDAYVAPVREATQAGQVTPNADLQGLADFFKQAEQIPGVYVKMAEASRKDNEAKATKDYMNGVKDNPKDKGIFESFLNPGVGYANKWDVLHGEAKMSQARINASVELEANHYFVNDPDRDKKVQEVINKHYEASGIDHNNSYQMVGASAEYQKLQEVATAGVAKTYWDKKVTDHVNDVGTRIGTLISGYRQQLKKDGKAFDPFEARALFGSVRDVIDPNLVPPEQQSQVIVNSILNDTKKQIKFLTDEGRLDEAAELQQDVMLALRTSDKSGFNWSTVLDKTGKRINGENIDMYDDHFTGMIDKAEKEIIRENEKTYQENHSFFLDEMYRLGTREGVQNYQKVIDKAYEDGMLDEVYKADLTKTVNRFMQTTEYVIEDPKKSYALLANVYAGRAKISEVNQALNDNIIRLDTAEKAMGIIERLKAQEAALAAEGRSRDFLTWQTLYGQGHTNLFNRYKEDNPTREAAETYYNSLIHDQKIPPVQAYQKTLDVFKDGTINSKYKSPEEAAAAVRDSARKLKAGQTTQAEHKAVIQAAKPWELVSKYQVDAMPAKTTPTKK